MVLIAERRRKTKGLTRRKLVRWLLWAGAGAVVAAAAGYTFYGSRVREVYHEWRRQKAMAQAKKFVAEKDGGNAAVALQIAIQESPANPEGWRVVADLLEQSGNERSLMVRKNIVRLPGATTEDRLALALNALHFGDTVTATEALRDVPAAEQTSTAYRRVSARLALATGQPAVANALLDSLLKENPGDDSVKLAVAALRLRHPQATAAAAARHELETLAQQPGLRLAALRELTLDALFRKDYPAATRYATDLVATPGALFSDRLTAANVALFGKTRPVAEIVAALRAPAAESPANAVDYARWLLAQGRAADVTSFATTLPSASRETPAFREVEADAAAGTQDWRRFTELLRAGAWGPVKPEIVDVAMAAHAMGSRERADLRRSLWGESLKTAESSLDSLRLLQRLTVLWNWTAERIDTLLVITKTYPREYFAHEALAREYAAARDTANLETTLHRWMDADPGNQRVKNDWVLVALLRDPSALLPKQIARELWRAHPENAFYATAQAFALSLSGEAKEGVKLVDSLSDFDRAQAVRAPYLATVYARAGRTQDAIQFADLANKAPALLPEEHALANDARHPPTVRPPRPAPAAPKPDRT